MKKVINDKEKVQKILFILIFLLGIFARVWQFGKVPGGINQDEAFAGYEAYSLLHYGTDSFGYHMPVYLTTWGSGMNALNTYLMIPFIAIFGLKTWVIRLPQVIAAILSLLVCYFLMKRLFDKKMGLVAMFILSVVPWHIMLARWGLESNLAPGFLLFGLYFFVLGLDNSRYYIISAVMYGLSLYTYATIWPFVPIIILMQILYAAYIKKIRIEKNILISVCILGLMAAPLLLFLMVNADKIDEIKTDFISIPKLLYMRNSEISFSNISENFKNIIDILINQTDGLITNVCDKYGLFYKFTIAFFILGLIIVIFNSVKALYKREKSGYIFILIQFIGGFLLSILINVNVNRANYLMMSIVLISAIGVYNAINKLNKYFFIVIAMYLISFTLFINYYFTSYNQEAAFNYSIGLEAAMNHAMQNEGTIYVTSSVSQSRVMFYSKIPVDEYIDTVEYNNYPGAFIGTNSFGRFCMNFDINLETDDNGTYILDVYTDATALLNAGFKATQYDCYTVFEK